MTDRRDELAYRYLRGETLTDEERADLDAANREIERATPGPVPLPSAVRAIVEEVLWRTDRSEP